MAVESQLLRMRTLNFGYYGGFTPIYWDERSATLRISQSQKRLGCIKVQLLLLLLLAYETFSETRMKLYQSVKALENGSLKRRIGVIYVTMVWVFMNIHHVGNIWTGDYVELMNKLNEYRSTNINGKQPLRVI